MSDDDFLFDFCVRGRRGVLSRCDSTPTSILGGVYFERYFLCGEEVWAEFSEHGFDLDWFLSMGCISWLVERLETESKGD